MVRQLQGRGFVLLVATFVAVAALAWIILGPSDGGAGGVDLAEAAEPPAINEPSAPASRPAAERDPGITLPGDGTPTLTVRRGERVALRDQPGGEIIAKLSDTTEFDSPTVLSAAKRQGNWVGVPTELLPNGQLGWVKLDLRKLEIDSVGQSIVIDLSAMTGKLFRKGDLERKWQVGIGAPGTPTPIGQFSITDEIETGLDPTYGCCAIALSATQPNLPAGWTGGNRIAIHGTSVALGEANSTGCVHSGEDDLQALIEGVPLGTPVTIRP